MRLPVLLLTVPLVLSIAACGGGDDNEGVTTAPPETTTTTAAPTSAAPSASASVGAPAAGDDRRLIGTIGTSDEPEAFEIGLTNPDGTPAEDLPAGSYTITVDDASFMHNWRLTGEGVDVATGVAAKESKVFQVELVAGQTYTFVCDPHTSSMSGEVTVV